MIAKDPQVLLQDLVHTFGLSVGLAMEGRGLIAVNVAKFKKARGKPGCELSPPVCDDVIRKAMMLEYVLQVQSGRLCRIDLGGGGTKMCHLGEAVHTNEDSV